MYRQTEDENQDATHHATHGSICPIKRSCGTTGACIQFEKVLSRQNELRVTPCATTPLELAG
jgi:hypothetical protein